MKMNATMTLGLGVSKSNLTKPTEKDILIMGIGNILMGDEGIGVHVVQEMEKLEWPEHVQILDGGTGGFHLLQYLQEYENVIMVDATMDGNAPGTINVIYPKFSSDFPSALTAHDIGLKDLIESVILTDRLPNITLVTVSISDIQYMKLELSEPLKHVIPQVIRSIREQLD